MSIRTSLACFAIAMCLVCGQVMFKLAATKANSLSNALLSPWLLAALGLYGMMSLLWVYVLIDTPLSKAYPYLIFGAALVPLASFYIFREPVSNSYALGLAFLLLGMYLTQAGG